MTDLTLAGFPRGSDPARDDPGASERDGASGSKVMDPDLPPSVEAYAVSHLFDQIGTGGVVNLLLVALVTSVVWGAAPVGVALGWAGSIVIVTGARFLLSHRYRRVRAPDPTSWGQRYAAAMAASALLWGLAAPLFVPSIPPERELALIVAIAGISAGALPTNAAIFRVYLIYLGAALLPVAATYLALGDRTHLLLGGMTLLYGAALAVTGRTYNRYLLRAYDLSAQLHEANRELERRASHDALTGLWNRARFETALDHELARAERYGHEFSLIMLDVDHFKTVNDTRGHGTGDRVLARLGRLLAEEVRETDRVARWGGEEFMVLMPGSGPGAARAGAERLRRRAAETSFEDSVRVTLSLGVTTCRPGEPRATFLKRLDDALYEAKQRGRNRTHVVAGPGGTDRG